jgi:hypothetical protein
MSVSACNFFLGLFSRLASHPTMSVPWFICASVCRAACLPAASWALDARPVSFGLSVPGSVRSTPWLTCATACLSSAMPLQGGICQDAGSQTSPESLRSSGRGEVLERDREADPIPWGSPGAPGPAHLWPAQVKRDRHLLGIGPSCSPLCSSDQWKWGRGGNHLLLWVL